MGDPDTDWGDHVITIVGVVILVIIVVTYLIAA